MLVELEFICIVRPSRFKQAMTLYLHCCTMWVCEDLLWCEYFRMATKILRNAKWNLRKGFLSDRLTMQPGKQGPAETEPAVALN